MEEKITCPVIPYFDIWNKWNFHVCTEIKQNILKRVKIGDT